MDGHKKEENRERLSEEFVYDSNCQKYIGKRTGNLYRRVNFKLHFDGFPRFSDYESHHQMEYSSLAKSNKMDPANLDQDREKRISRQKWREESIHNKEINVEGEEEKKQSCEKEGKDLEEFQSTIMKKNSITQLKTSEKKDYINLLKEMHINGEQSFLFKEQRLQNEGQILFGSQNKRKKEKDRLRVTFYENTTNQDRNINQNQESQEKQGIEKKKNNEKYLENSNAQQEIKQQEQLQMKNKKLRKQKNEKKKQRRERSSIKEQIREIKCSSKYCVLTQQKQIIKKQNPFERQIKQCQRYPKRIKMNSVQFWENEKAHQRRRTRKIERSTLNMKSLICTKETYPNKIKINTTTNNIEIQVKIPGKKELRSSGIPDIYQKLQISLTRKLDHQLIHYQDAIKKLPFVYGQTITVDPLIQFLLSNWSKKPVTLLMTLVVKND